MMRKKRKKFCPRFVVSLLVFLLVFFFFEQAFQFPVQNLLDPYTNVKQYTTEVEKELEKYGLEQYTLALIALMQQESRGRGGDPMQSSESAGLPPNSINDPQKSIEYGVKHFQSVYSYGTEKNVDFSTIIQAYNMGMGYIDHVAAAGGKHTEELAKQYSMKQVEKNPELYNCGGNKNNFRYPYCYGDFTYSEKVAKNIEDLSESLPALKNEAQTGDPY
ncbi:lysozyme family protein [Bacillaceae bacterium Marseille-Q3522]|nr:lysozyme family protein [Bacillaceae bacterium Marseille-Q3522]